MAGALVTEIVFSYPGLGYLILQAINNQDFFLIQGAFLFIIIGVLLANFLIDIVYVLVDPRTRVGMRGEAHDDLRPPEELAAATPARDRGHAGSPAAKARGRREALYFARRNRKLLVGLVVVLAFLVVAAVGPLLTDHGPNEYVGPAGQRPSARFWFGTTMFGQDVFAQFAHGLRSTFLVGLLGGGLAAVIGMLIGFTAGYRGGAVDEVLNMVTNVVLVIPTLAVLLIIADLPAGPGRRPRGHLHRAVLLAVGGQGDQGPDLLAAVPRLRRPGPPQRRRRGQDSSSARSPRT